MSTTERYTWVVAVKTDMAAFQEHSPVPWIYLEPVQNACDTRGSALQNPASGQVSSLWSDPPDTGRGWNHTQTAHIILPGFCSKSSRHSGSRTTDNYSTVSSRRGEGRKVSKTFQRTFYTSGRAAYAGRERKMGSGERGRKGESEKRQLNKASQHAF